MGKHPEVETLPCLETWRQLSPKAKLWATTHIGEADTNHIQELIFPDNNGVEIAELLVKGGILSRTPEGYRFTEECLPIIQYQQETLRLIRIALRF